MHIEPWSFDKNLVALQRYDKDVSLAKLKFDKVTFWVQVHDIPISFMTKKVAEGIRDKIGELTQAIDTVNDEGGSFIRVRVVIDVSLPLCRGLLLLMFPNLCFWCGCLNHDNKNCNLWIQSKGTLSPEKKTIWAFHACSPISTFQEECDHCTSSLQ